MPKKLTLHGKIIKSIKISVSKKNPSIKKIAQKIMAEYADVFEKLAK